MEYIVHTEYNKKAICGEVNLPVGTALQKVGGMIYLRAKPICMATSETALQHFTRNDDGQGLKRHELIMKIKEILKEPPVYEKILCAEHEENPDAEIDSCGCEYVMLDCPWKRLLDDEKCAKFDKNTNGDTWLWNADFYNADIEELEYITGILAD